LDFGRASVNLLYGYCVQEDAVVYNPTDGAELDFGRICLVPTTTSMLATAFSAPQVQNPMWIFSLRHCRNGSTSYGLACLGVPQSTTKVMADYPRFWTLKWTTRSLSQPVSRLSPLRLLPQKQHHGT
jgi:hypothetical protein